MNVEIYEHMYLSEKDNWWFKGRRELITDMVARACKPQRGEALKIPDVGCGTGLNSQAFEQFGEVYGLDMSREALGFSKLRGKSNLIQAYADHLPIEDDTFDVLCALDLLEHIEDDIGAIKEFHRVLKPGGRLILTVPAFMSLWSSHDDVLHHKRRYNKTAFIRELKSCNFYLDRLTYWNFFLFPAVALARIIHRGASDAREGGKYGLPDLPEVLNRLLLQLLRVETAAIRRGHNLPVGVSMFCICKKHED
jgi:SAM-dependent methyltransferase